MKRIRRNIFNSLAALSLLLCLATCALWVRSYSSPESIELRRGRAYVVGSSHGLILIHMSYVIRGPTAEPRVETPFASEWTFEHKTRTDFDFGAYTRFGFDLSGGEIDISNITQFRNIGGYRSATFPDWALMILLAVVCACSWGVARKRGANRKPGVCLNCGYDLRATRDRCPECGAVPIHEANP